MVCAQWPGPDRDKLTLTTQPTGTRTVIHICSLISLCSRSGWLATTTRKSLLVPGLGCDELDGSRTESTASPAVRMSLSMISMNVYPIPCGSLTHPSRPSPTVIVAMPIVCSVHGPSHGHTYRTLVHCRRCRRSPSGFVLVRGRLPVPRETIGIS